MKNINFEQALSRLEEIASTLEQGDSSLDDTIKLFEEAKELSTFCQEKLNTAEQKLLILEKNDEISAE